MTRRWKVHQCRAAFGLLFLLTGLRTFGVQQAVAQTGALAAPTALTATAVRQTPTTLLQITLRWMDNSTNEAGFELWRREGSGSWALRQVVSANTTTFADTPLKPLTTYTYQLRAKQSDAVSAFSNEAGDTTYESIPDAPGDLTATAVSPTQINLVWSDYSDTETHFLITRSVDARGYFPASLAVVPANVTAFSDRSCDPNREYHYFVQAVNSGGASAASHWVDQRTPATATIAAPGGLAVTALAPTQLNLRWADNSPNETAFEIERKPAGGSFGLLVRVGPNTTAGASFTDAVLAPNTTYTYRVRALLGLVPSGYSNESSAVTLPNPPIAPTDLIVRAVSQNGLELLWSDTSGTGTGFEVERKTAGGSFVRVATVAANVFAYLDTGLPAGTRYLYRLRAVNSGGASAYTDEASAITLRPVSVAYLALPSPVTGGSVVTGIVTLDAPAPAGGLSVTLTSSAPATANPATATLVFAVGEVAKAFTLRTTAVTAATTVTLTAAANGYETTALVSLRP